MPCTSSGTDLHVLGRGRVPQRIPWTRSEDTAGIYPWSEEMWRAFVFDVYKQWLSLHLVGSLQVPAHYDDGLFNSFLIHFLVANTIPEVEIGTTISNSSMIHMTLTILKPTSSRTWRGLTELRQTQHWMDMVRFLPAQQLPISRHSVCTAMSLFPYDLLFKLGIITGNPGARSANPYPYP